MESRCRLTQLPSLQAIYWRSRRAGWPRLELFFCDGLASPIITQFWIWARDEAWLRPNWSAAAAE
jgi:hypothetical protein